MLKDNYFIFDKRIWGRALHILKPLHLIFGLRSRPFFVSIDQQSICLVHSVEFKPFYASACFPYFDIIHKRVKEICIHIGRANLFSFYLSPLNFLLHGLVFELQMIASLKVSSRRSYFLFYRSRISLIFWVVSFSLQKVDKYPLESCYSLSQFR